MCSAIMLVKECNLDAVHWRGFQVYSSVPIISLMPNDVVMTKF